MGIRKYAYLSIAAATSTIVLKVGAYFLTDSVGLLSDALESGVNLIAAIIALIALTVAEQPPDEEHAYGHSKVEYFSSGAEGTLILLAAIAIIVSAISRLVEPRPIVNIDTGLIISAIAALLNFAVARILMQAGDKYRSITLVADARHLMTDVWTTGGVLVGVSIAAVTGWQILDPLIALVVAIQIILSGVRLIRESALGLMDSALPDEDLNVIHKKLEDIAGDGVQYHALRTRRSGRQRFMSVHIQVPGNWSVLQGHSLLEEFERAIREDLTPITVFTHLEPLEDPRSWQDISINREDV